MKISKYLETNERSQCFNFHIATANSHWQCLLAAYAMQIVFKLKLKVVKVKTEETLLMAYILVLSEHSQFFQLYCSLIWQDFKGYIHNYIQYMYLSIKIYCTLSSIIWFYYVCLLLCVVVVVIFFVFVFFCQKPYLHVSLSYIQSCFIISFSLQWPHG